MESKHSELPWRIAINDGTLILPENGELIGDSIVVTETNRLATLDVAHANAEFIVRACNSHYELLKAAKNILGGIQTGLVTSDADETFANATRDLANAIARAESTVKAVKREEGE